MKIEDKIKLAELTIQYIETLLTGKDELMNTGMAKLIGIESVISRYKYYSLYPEQIPPYVISEINKIN